MPQSCVLSWTELPASDRSSAPRRTHLRPFGQQFRPCPRDVDETLDHWRQCSVRQRDQGNGEVPFRQIDLQLDQRVATSQRSGHRRDVRSVSEKVHPQGHRKGHKVRLRKIETARPESFLLALSGHRRLTARCPLSGVKQTSKLGCRSPLLTHSGHWRGVASSEHWEANSA